MDKDSLINLGLKKVAHETDLSWREIGEMFDLDAESCRQIVKRYRKCNGLIESPTKNLLRILHISDNHYPFNLPHEVYEDYVGKVDILVWNGDEQDCQGISCFAKKYRVPFVDELVGCRQMMIDTINYIKPKSVIINKGNHNVRLINYFSDRIHEDLLSLMPETNLDFIVDLGFYRHDHQTKSKTYFEPLVKVFENKVEIWYTKEWCCRVGNTIFAHPKAYKNGILGTSEKAYLHFLQRGEEPFDCLVLAHTHNMGMARYGKTYLYESGALCHEPSYSTDGNMNKPQTRGFFYCVQDQSGNFLYDLSKLVCL